MRPITKIATYAGIVLLIAAITIFWVGSKKRRYRVEKVINAPPQAVFKHITDPALIKGWAAEVVSIEPSSDEKLHEVGAKAKIVVEEDGREIEMTDEVKTSDEDSRLVVASKCAYFRASSDYQLQDKGEGQQTELRLVLEVQHSGFFRFVAPFMANPVQEKTEANLQRLKIQVEKDFAENPEKYPPKTEVPENKNAADQDTKSTVSNAEPGIPTPADPKTNNGNQQNSSGDNSDTSKQSGGEV